MAERGNWQRTDVRVLGSYTQLSEREQSAVRTAVSGLKTWKLLGTEPKPMRVTVSDERPFNLRGFAQVMHELGVGITDTLRPDGENAFVFQPRPYNSESLEQQAQRRTRVVLGQDELELLKRLFSL